MVLEWAEGQDLAEYVDTHDPLSLPRVREIMRQLCLALGAAHAVGVVHHDVKPANVVVRHCGSGLPRVKLVDFGLARHADDAPLPSDDSPCGTPFATSPEQVLSPEENDPRCDVWGACVIAYFLLTGKAPFGTDDMLATLLAIEAQAFIPVSQHRNEPAGMLDAFFRRAFKRDRRERFGTIEEAAFAFEVASAASLRSVVLDADANASRAVRK
jgi:serine/threonine-protein kinase